MMKQDEVFATSGCPTYLEWYRCYDDPARSVWVDGMEFRNHPEWSEIQKAKWHFFYRPIPSAIGRPQWRMIRDLQAKITATRETLKTRVQVLAILLIFGVSVAGIAGWNSIAWLMNVSILAPALGVLEFILAKNFLERNISDWEVRIVALKGEIATLLGKIPEPPSAQVVEQWLFKELGAMERKCLGELINEIDLDQERLKELLRHQAIQESSPARGVLIQGWGLLQPAQISGPFGGERTGKNRMIRDIKGGIATWRVGTQGQPVYRAIYLQYVFLLRTNISVYSFFFDVVTRKTYGCRGETFEYGHVTNFLVRELDGDEGSLGLQDIRSEGLEDLLCHLFQEEINEVALAVSSGSHFRCVLTDNAVIKGMNDWLDADEKYTRLAEGKTEGEDGVSSQDLGELEEHSGLSGKWRLSELANKRVTLAELSLGTGWKALQQIRDGVEAYARAPFDDSVRWS